MATYISFGKKLSRKESSYLSMARGLALRSTSRRKHGAVVVKSGRVLGTGFNKDRNNPIYVSPEHIKTQCSVHAEISAIKDANTDVRGAVLYVARINRHGEDRNSRPCKNCEAVITKLNIKKVIYTEG